MALDILKIIYDFNINLVAVEVEPEVAYIKVDGNDDDIKITELTKRLLGNEDVKEVKSINVLPQEEKEKFIKAVVDSNKEGIIAINDEHIVTLMNSSAEKILNINSIDIVGGALSNIFTDDHPIFNTIKTGEQYNDLEVNISSENFRGQVISSGRPIFDEEHVPIGAVNFFQSIESVMELVYTFTRPSMITFDEIMGISNKLNEVKKLAKAIANSDSTVLIRGETGTGKELFARSIHMASNRKDKPFVPINCAAIPDSLLESELFGYEEGAFTGAIKGGKHGLFKFADNGTLFLDEIGELSTHLQVKLLRVLQDGKIRRVGGFKEIPVDVRIIAATNRDLEEQLKRGQFRDDLYYRLNVIPIKIPPLRERKEDIAFLANYFVRKLSKKMNKTIIGIDNEASLLLLNHTWPGNVRELENAIERAMNLTDDIIRPSHIFSHEEINLPDGGDIVEHDKCYKLKDMIAITEKKIILEAISKHGSIRKAANALGVSHVTILNKIKKHN